jgi:NhaP-type Na+/H+ or K+/H+ antiporter
LNNEILLSLTGIAVLGIACQWLAWWAKLPAILFLLLCGIIIGPVTGLLNPDQLFGELLFPAVSLSVAVILFEGSLTLKFEEIKGLGFVVRSLISTGALITWIITATAAHYLLELPIELAGLFGAMVVVTGPTVIIPMLRSVRPNAKIANILRWEGIVIDPLGALLAVLVYEFIISSQSGQAFENVLLSFGSIITTGFVVGFALAHLLGLILRRHLAPEYLRNVLSLILVFAAYTFSDIIEHESGLLAVTIMGMVLANMKNTNIDDILDFKESLSVLLISGLFIILAARVEFEHFNQLGWGAVGVLATLMLVARPVSVFMSTLGSDLSLNEKLLIAWIGPRGIVAAAVASLFSLRLEEAGYIDAVFLVPLTFMIIIGTVVIQSATSKSFAKILQVSEPPPTGVLIIGAGNVARAIGKAIQDQGFRVILTDSNWENTSLARMEGLNTYYGNPISEHAERHLDMVGIGKMLAMSGRANLDTLASLRFKSDFGEKGIYELKTTREKIISDKHKISTRHRGYQLFGEDITHGVLASWLRNDAEIRSTQLGDEFDFEAYMAKNTGKIIALFAIDHKKRLQFFVTDGKMKPESGWTIISLIQPGLKQQAAENNNDK